MRTETDWDDKGAGVQCMMPGCDNELDKSPSDYFCGPDCQELWYQSRLTSGTTCRPAWRQVRITVSADRVARDTLRLTDAGARLIRELGLDRWPE